MCICYHCKPSSLLFVPRSSLFAYMVFIKDNEINESYKLCQVRDKHTVGGSVLQTLISSLSLLNCILVKGVFITYFIFDCN